MSSRLSCSSSSYSSPTAAKTTPGFYVHLPLPQPLYFTINSKQYELPEVPRNPSLKQQWTIAEATTTTSSTSGEDVFNRIASSFHAVKLGQLRKRRSQTGDFPTIEHSNFDSISLKRAKRDHSTSAKKSTSSRKRKNNQSTSTSRGMLCCLPLLFFV